MTTVRFLFTKTGDSAYISLLDLQRVMQRAFKRSRLPAWYTLGFNPHIYMTFAAPLSLGQESRFEIVDVKCEQEDFDWSGAPAVLNACLPNGIVVQSAKPAKTDASAIAFAQYEIQYAPQHAQEAQRAFAFYEALSEALVEKKGKKGSVKQLDLKQQIQLLNTKADENGFTITLLVPAGNTLNVNPMLLLQFLQAQCALPCTQGNILRMALLVPRTGNQKSSKVAARPEADLNLLRPID